MLWNFLISHNQWCGFVKNRESQFQVGFGYGSSRVCLLASPSKFRANMQKAQKGLFSINLTYSSLVNSCYWILIYSDTSISHYLKCSLRNHFSYFRKLKKTQFRTHDFQKFRIWIRAKLCKSTKFKLESDSEYRFLVTSKRM